ncbi:hypothetical protein BGZ94_002464 [Podila epigama]|nr:hypothetical protein BGZ94_002464 [Podila epigama]
MARHSNASIAGHSLHGQTKAELMRLHKQSLEKTLNNTLTIVDDTKITQEQQQKQRLHNKKKKKYYPWLQRDSQNQREKIGLEDKFTHHPFAVLYAIDMPFPGYGHDAPSFHWKYDAMIDSLIRNNPPSTRRSKVDETGADHEDAKANPAGPMIGHRCLTRAQRKDIKRVHVPQGVIMQYEGELVEFLNQLTMSPAIDSTDSHPSEVQVRSDAHDCSSDNNETGHEMNTEESSEPELVESGDTEESTDDDDLGSSEQQKSRWVLVHNPTDKTSSSPTASTITIESEDGNDFESSLDSKSTKTALNRPKIYLRWDIPDQFLRFVAHALSSFYGLVSFSKTALDGKRWVYVCHPTHLDAIGLLSRQKILEHVQELPMNELDLLWDNIPAHMLQESLQPETTFFEYLYPQ